MKNWKKESDGDIHQISFNLDQTHSSRVQDFIKAGEYLTAPIWTVIMKHIFEISDDDSHQIPLNLIK